MFRPRQEPSLLFWRAAQHVESKGLFAFWTVRLQQGLSGGSGRPSYVMDETAYFANLFQYFPFHCGKDHIQVLGRHSYGIFNSIREMEYLCVSVQHPDSSWFYGMDAFL